MARIPYFDMANAPESYQALLKSRNPLNLYRMLPHAGPTAAAGFLAMGSALLRDNEIDSQLREIAILRVGILSKAGYEVYQHKRVAKQVGLSEASIAALDGPQDCVNEIVAQYQSRRDVLARGLHEAGWNVEIPKASMYIWAQIPEPYRAMGSLEFAKRVLSDAKVAVSPGIGFGEYGDEYVRFALIENEQRTRQAVRGIKDMFRKDGYR